MKFFFILLILVLTYFAGNLYRYELPSEISQPQVTSTHLPIISITFESITTKGKRPGWIEVISENPLEKMGPYPIAIESSGNTAIRFPKKRLSFQFGKKSNWLEGTSRKMLDLRSDDDWVLDGTYRDRLLFRNKLNHDLYTDLRGKKETISSRFVEVYINNDFEGVYILSERIDRKQLGLPKRSEISIKELVVKYFEQVSHSAKNYYIHRLNRMIYRTIIKFRRATTHPEKLDTVLYKASLAGANLKINNPMMTGFYQKYPHEKYGPDSSNLTDFILFINNSTIGDFRKNIWKYLDRGATLDYLYFMLLNTGYDNMQANYYLQFFDKKFKFIPWDLDGTLGRQGSDNRVLIKFDTWRFSSNGLFLRLFRGDDPQFLRDLIDGWFKKRRNLFSKESLNSRFNKYYSNLEKSDALYRNHKRWGFLENKSELDKVSQINELRDWIDKRLKFVDQKLRKVRADLLDK